MSAETSSVPCRLCGAPAHALFRQNVRDRIPVWFHECGACRSLQGEPGSWLEEGRARHSADIGRVRRSLDTAILIDVALQLLGGAASRICLDFGGGDGLFARMMRDRGYNFFCRDPLIANVYTPFHDALAKPVRDVAVVTAFDVLDYCADPAATLEDLFAFEADLVMASAETWQGQGPDWPGLGLEDGRRGFFYSPEALDMLAGRHGYHLLTDGRLHVFCRPRPRRLSYDSAQIRRLTAQLAWGNLEKLALKHFHDRLRQPYCFVQEDYRGILRDLRAAHPFPPPPITAAAPPASRREVEAEGTVVVDGAFYQMNDLSGIARVWTSVLTHWAGSDWARRVVVLDRGGTAPRVPGIRYRMVEPHSYGDPAGLRRRLQRCCDQDGAAVFISTYYSAPERTPSVLLVHDMIPERMGYDLKEPMWVEKAQAIAHAQAFVCVSQRTAEDLLSLHPHIEPSRVRVAHLGYGQSFRAQPADKVFEYRLGQGLARDYLLMVGPRHGYKNGMAFFKAWASLPEEHRPDVVVVDRNSLEPEIQALVPAGAAVRVMQVSDDALALLYAGATALVMPSLYEGFGLPALEAMACGCPVVCSRHGSLPEVGGEAVLYVDPDDLQAMAAALIEVQDPKRRCALVEAGLQRAQGFSWSTIADSLRESLLAVIASS